MNEITAAHAHESDRYDYWPSRNLRSTGLWRSPFLMKAEQRALECAVIWSKRELTIRLGIDGETDIAFPFPLRQEQIGDLLGLTNIHVNRTIQQMRGQGLIQLCDRMLTIPDVPSLRGAAGFDPGYLHLHRHIDAAARPTVEVA